MTTSVLVVSDLEPETWCPVLSPFADVIQRSSVGFSRAVTIFWLLLGGVTPAVSAFRSLPAALVGA